MKQYGKYLAAAGIAAFGIIFSCLSASAWGRMAQAKDRVMLYLKNPISLEEASAVVKQNQEAAEEYQQGQEVAEEYQQGRQGAEEYEQGQQGKEPAFQFCIWGQKEDVLLSNENLSRSVKADAIVLCGNPELLFEDCRMPVREDDRGCLLDEKAAWELFGDVQAAGKEISCEGKNYTIRNVVPGTEGLIAFQAGKGQAEKSGGLEGEKSSDSIDGVMQRITIQKPEGYSVDDLESAWSNRYGIFADVLDTELLRGIGGCCVLLFPISLCLLFGIYLYRQRTLWDVPSWASGRLIGDNRQKSFLQKSFLQKAAAVELLLVLAAMLLLFLKGFVKIPEGYIPTRWSEFSFWARLWETKTEGVRLLLRMPKSVLDAGWMGDFFRAAAYGLLAEALLGIAWFFIKCSSKQEQKESSKMAKEKKEEE